jgi:hypothetical protein
LISGSTSLQARREPLEVGPIPHQVGLLGDGDAAGHAVPHQQRIADVAQHRAAAVGSPLLGELARERLDLIERGRDLALVAGQHHALRQRDRRSTC